MYVQQGPDSKVAAVNDEVKTTLGATPVHLITPQAERAWIALQEAQANQRDRASRIHAIGILKQSKTTEIQQAIGMAKSVCPETDLDHPLWVRVVTMQKESEALEKKIEGLLQTSRRTCPEVEKYLGTSSIDDAKEVEGQKDSSETAGFGNEAVQNDDLQEQVVEKEEFD